MAGPGLSAPAARFHPLPGAAKRPVLMGDFNLLEGSRLIVGQRAWARFGWQGLFLFRKGS